MIPKIIHYCWFGGKPLDTKSKKCIESWKKYFYDYEIKEWNESNFDYKQCRYSAEAYNEKKWAFVSDYARFKILYEYGGIYFDTDVEIIKDLSPILKNGAFMGCENPKEYKNISVAPGLGIASPAGLPFYKEMADDYEKSSFYKKDGSLNLYTVVERTTDNLKKHGLKNENKIQNIAEINIYPSEYFCPINMSTGKLETTNNTYSIHHFAGSWEKKSNKFRGRIYRLINRYLGKNTADFAKKILGRKGNK
ncbi:MAG: glycosyltransferase [Clostridia bacterium]|nr:glycosyltransferase [Clostridia bacterium]